MHPVKEEISLLDKFFELSLLTGEDFADDELGYAAVSEPEASASGFPD